MIHIILEAPESLPVRHAMAELRSALQQQGAKISAEVTPSTKVKIVAGIVGRSGEVDRLLKEHQLSVPNRAEIVRGIPRNTRQSVINLDGPGCIRHIALVTRDTRNQKPVHTSRDMIIRIYFDDAEVPQVEAPFGDFLA
jgi:hypothetical protein